MSATGRHGLSAQAPEFVPAAFAAGANSGASAAVVAKLSSVETMGSTGTMTSAQVVAPSGVVFSAALAQHNGSVLPRPVGRKHCVKCVWHPAFRLGCNHMFCDECLRPLFDSSGGSRCCRLCGLVSQASIHALIYPIRASVPDPAIVLVCCGRIRRQC